MSIMNTPVALIIFNRPQYTRKVWERICAIKPSKLFIIADAPRREKGEQEQQLCAEAREITEMIDWPCAVERIYATENLGTRKRISSGLTEMFQHTDRAIILEDDCVPEISFFTFCEEMLEKYSDNKHIMMVGGDNPIAYPLSDSYTFSRFFPIWGWATWKRAWDMYDDSMSQWPERKTSRWLKSLYPHRGVRLFLTQMFDQAYYQNLDSWATRWFYSCLAHEGISIVPAQNLISNIGIDGTHSSGGHNNLPTTPLSFPLQHPITITENREYDTALFNWLFPWQPIPHPRVMVLKVLVLGKRILRSLGIVS